MWELTLTYTDDKTGKSCCYQHKISNEAHSKADKADLGAFVANWFKEVEKDIAWLDRQEAQNKLLARNCTSMEELDAALTHWWQECQRYSEALKYSASCISDSERQREALAHWQECVIRIQRIRSGKETF